MNVLTTLKNISYRQIETFTSPLLVLVKLITNVLCCTLIILYSVHKREMSCWSILSVSVQMYTWLSLVQGRRYIY